MASLTPIANPMPRSASGNRLNQPAVPILCRQDLTRARRVVIKCGTSVVSNEGGHFSLTRLAAIVEQASELLKSGVEVNVYTAWLCRTCYLWRCVYEPPVGHPSKCEPRLCLLEAMELGLLLHCRGDIHHLLRVLLLTSHQVVLVTSGAVGCGRLALRKQAILKASFHQQLHASAMQVESTGYSSAAASAGQLGLMSLYETLFSQCDVGISQFLVGGTGRAFVFLRASAEGAVAVSGSGFARSFFGGHPFIE